MISDEGSAACEDAANLACAYPFHKTYPLGGFISDIPTIKNIPFLLRQHRESLVEIDSDMAGLRLSHDSPMRPGLLVANVVLHAVADPLD